MPIVTRGHTHDLDALRAVVGNPMRYIGLIGSKAKVRRIFDVLREEGFAQLGFSVFRWTWSDVYHRPDAVAHRALVFLTRRGYRP